LIKGDDGQGVQYFVDTVHTGYPELPGFLTFERRPVQRTFFGDKLFILLKSCQIPEKPRHHSFTQTGCSGYSVFDLSDRDALCEALKHELAIHDVTYNEASVRIVVFPPGPKVLCA